MLKKTLMLGVLGTVLMFGLTSCSDDDDKTTPTGNTPTANVMAVHASPDAPAVDLYVDDALAGSDLAFPQNTGYLPVPSGNRNIKVNVAGSETTVIDADLTLTAGASYSVFAIDSVSKIAPLVTVDTLTTPAAGKAHVRFVHLSPDAPAVNVTLTDGTIVFGNKAFKERTSFTPLDAGTYNLQVRDAATNSAVVLALDNVTLTAGKIYTVFARGFASGLAAQALGAQIIANN